LRGIRRAIGSAKQGKSPATADVLTQMVALCSETLIGKRDRALLCFGFASAMRRSELCALEVADLTETPDGLRVMIRHSKGDQEGQGQEIAIPRGYRLRPVEAVQTWLAAAEITQGLVFRSVARGGRVGGGLNPESAARIIKGYAERLGLDPASFAGRAIKPSTSDTINQAPAALHPRLRAVLQQQRGTRQHALIPTAPRLQSASTISSTIIVLRVPRSAGRPKLDRQGHFGPLCYCRRSARSMANDCHRGSPLMRALISGSCAGASDARIRCRSATAKAASG
jgi:hypothetical protein